MKNIALIILVVFISSCEKKESAEPKPETASWIGMYHCSNLIDQLSGQTVNTSTYINIVSESDNTVSLSVVLDRFGAAYFHSVLSNQNVSNHVDLLNGVLSGSIVTLNPLHWMTGATSHDLLNATMDKTSDRVIKLTYTETIYSPFIRTRTNTYTGTFTK